MIRIKVSNIKNWDLIKAYHNEYYHKTVIKKLEDKAYLTLVIQEEIKKEIQIQNAKPKGKIIINQKDLTSKITIYLLELNKINLATGDISILKIAIESYNKFFDSLKIKPNKKIVKNILKKIFNYKNFNTGLLSTLDGEERLWNRHELLSLMDIRTCPYCNRQYITNYFDKKNGYKTTADIDHFFLQSEYPMLALSLYNFIPSCQICNSRMKGAKFEAEKHIYPYEEEFGSNGKFRIISPNLNFLWEETKEFEIILEPKYGCAEEDKIKKSIETFKINEVYQTHKDYVQEIIKRAIIYDEMAIKDIETQYPNLFQSEKEIWQCLMGNYLCEEELGKRPLAKLTKDICEEFGISIS